MITNTVDNYDDSYPYGVDFSDIGIEEDNEYYINLISN